MNETLWDQHTCLDVGTTAEVTELTRYARRSGTLLSVHVSHSSHSRGDTLRVAER